MVGTRLVVIAAVASLLTSCGMPALKAQPRATVTPAVVTSGPMVAKPVKADPRIGAVFLGGNTVHSCTGAVLDSLAGNLIITAAHCMDSSAESLFVPGFAGSSAPTDFWRIDAVYLDPRWVRRQDPAVDIAIARVSHLDPTGDGTLEQRAGGGFVLGSAPGPDVDVTVTGYPTGDGGVPIGCSGTTVHPDRGFPALLCHGLVDGTSGAPWVSGATVRGVIGGLQGGGCDYSDVSYSSPFDLQTRLLYQRAQEGGPGDRANGAPDDGCSAANP
ncbi:MAG: serine protease [Mycobacterium sp.]